MGNGESRRRVGHVISRTQTNKLTNKWFLWTRCQVTLSTICCVCYAGWKAVIITGDGFLAVGWHKELPSIFIICLELWGQQRGLVYEKYFHSQLLTMSMTEMAAFTISHTKTYLYKWRHHHNWKLQGFREASKINRQRRQKWQIINTQSATVWFLFAMPW